MLIINSSISVHLIVMNLANMMLTNFIGMLNILVKYTGISTSNINYGFLFILFLIRNQS